MFIATQLNPTQLDVELSTRSQREQLSPINERNDPVDSVCTSWRHKQKHDWLGCTLFNWVSWVELCRYKHPFKSDTIGTVGMDDDDDNDDFVVSVLNALAEVRD